MQYTSPIGHQLHPQLPFESINAIRKEKMRHVVEDLRSYSPKLSIDMVEKIEEAFLACNQEFLSRQLSQAKSALNKKAKNTLSIVHKGGIDDFKVTTVIGLDVNTSETYIKIKNAWGRSILIGEGATGKVKIVLNLTEMRLQAQKTSKFIDAKKEFLMKEAVYIKLAEEAKGGRVVTGLIHFDLVWLFGNKMQFYMPFCDQGEMTKLFKKELSITPKEFCEIASSALEGLDALHTANPPIVHGDIKRENILIQTVRDSKKSGDQPKKIGVVIDAQGGFRPSLGETLVTHTIYYISPEALMMAARICGLPQPSPLNPNTPYDIWGMGCTLYECARGQPVPWTDDLDLLDDIARFKLSDKGSITFRLEKMLKRVQSKAIVDPIKQPLLKAMKSILGILNTTCMLDKKEVLNLWLSYKPYMECQARIFQEELEKSPDPCLKPLARMFHPEPSLRINAREASLSFKAAQTLIATKTCSQSL